MRVHVETYRGPDGLPLPRVFAFDGLRVEVAELIDQWHGEGYRYVKFRGDDGNLYILRSDDARNEWEMTLFESPRGAEMAQQHPIKKPKRRGNGPVARLS